MACSRPGGVSGNEDGHDVLSMLAARLAALLRLFNSCCCSGVGAIAASIWPNGQSATFADCSHAAATSRPLAARVRTLPPVNPAVSGLGPT